MKATAHRLTPGLLGACLLATLAGPVLSQSPTPEPPPWFGGRVEMTERGFAVTLPEDWVAFDLGADVPGQFEVALRSLGDIPDAQRVQAALEQGTTGGMQLAALDVAREGFCMFQVLSGQGWELAEFADTLYQGFLGWETVSDLEAPMPVTLAAGPAQALTMRIQHPDAPDLWGSQVIYLIPDGSDILLLDCGGPEPADDDWLSIADAIEFLPDEGS